MPVRGIAAVVGGFLLQFTMGAFYSFGNISTYMTSYMRQHGSPDITDTDFVVVQSTWGMTQGVVMPLSGFLINAIGQKASMVSGSILFSAGCALTYITISKVKARLRLVPDLNAFSSVRSFATILSL